MRAKDPGAACTVHVLVQLEWCLQHHTSAPCSWCASTGLQEETPHVCMYLLENL
jgi:hypothetical protein